MNQSIQRGTARRAHVLATHTVAPISRAVRAALTVSAAMLSLCVPVAGWAAGATSQDVPGHACALNGTFGQHAPEASFVLPVDLTVVAGEQLPTSVYPDAGLVGIDGSWAAGASGIVTAGGGAGVVHDVTVVDDADALAGGVDGVYAALTTDVLSTAGDIGIGNLDEVNLGARTYDGSAAALAASARGDYSQLHTGIEGVINADSVNGDANGIVASAVSHGFANVQNSTDINVSGYGTVTGLDAFDTNDSTVDNSAAITVHAYAGAGEAAAYGVRNGSNQRAYFNNTGEIGATAVSDTGVANAIGVLTGGFYSSDATNAGDISAMATGGQATAIGLVNESYFDATTTNAGSITVSADGTLAPYGQFEAVATGIYTFAANGNAVLNNSGSVSVVASATAQIESSAGFLVAKAIGVRAVSPSGYGGALIDNSGDISASAVTGQGYASAWGAIAQSDSNDVGNAQIDNDGSISSSAISGAGNSVTIGAYAHSGSTSIIVNHGDINATSRAERGIPDVSLATSYATGAQVYGYAYGGGEVNISNYGTIKAAASIEGGIAQATALKTFGSTSTVDNAEGATILATTRADLFGGAHSIAVEAGGVYNVDVVNNGSIAAYGYAHAYSVGEHGYYGASGAVGVEATANYRGNVSVVNHGDISAHAVADHSISWGQGGAAATGVNTYAKYTAFVENSSTISAVAEAEFGNVGSYGVMGRGKYYTHIINDAGATILASSSTGSLAGDQSAGRAVSFGTHTFGTQYGVTYNAGTIISQAVVTPDGVGNPEGPSMASAWGSAVGAYSSIQTGEVINHGDIEASARADFGAAKSFGTYALSHYDSSTSNSGTIQSTAAADHGNASAVGSYAFALHQQYYVPCDANNYCDYSKATFTADAGTASLVNSGAISAVATASGGEGYSYGAVIRGAFVTQITNSGHISASVDADNARAVGALGNSSYGYSMLTNGGTISAVASGDVASASGVLMLGAYGTGNVAVTVDNQGSILAKATGSTTASAIGIEATGTKGDGIQIDNSGTIAAAAYGTGATATGVSMVSVGDNMLTNSGTIGAYGDGGRIAVFSSADSTATIVNKGSMIGAIVTGSGDDSFTNAAGASWHAVGSSDFGDGDDHVVNRGTLFMDDAAIHLGGFTNGNTFDNFGTIGVSGAGNAIDMDNPFPVSNNGVISFVDGATDDILTIAGDLAGAGSINVDVSGLHQVSDRLYIDGNVLDSTKQTINVHLLDLPTVPSVDIPIVTATGTLGGTFTLGQIQPLGKGFVTTDFGLKTASGTVSLVMDVTGLNDAGSLASGVAPGVQNLVNSQIGTWRQRMGVVPEVGEFGLAPWVRLFSDSGDVNLARSGNFGPGGSDAFHQSNHGMEVGFDMRLVKHLSVGLVLGSADGTQNMAGSVGSNRLYSTTTGFYATWLSENHFYIDVSQRWNNVQVRMRSAEAATTTHASAATFNVEAGVTAWTMAGINVVPQVQYTHTRIDDISQLNVQQSTFADRGGVSSRGRVGVALEKTIQGGNFIWTPYGSVNAVREFNGKYDYAVNGGLLGSTSLEGTSAMVELGLGARRGGLSVTGGVNWTDGGSAQNIMGGQLVVRYNW